MHRWRTGVAGVAGLLLAAGSPAASPGHATPAPTADQPVSARPAAALRTAKVVIGHSVDDRKIVTVHRWRTDADKRVLVVGNLHGDEKAGIKVVKRLLRTPGRRIPGNVDLWLVRTANPDGTHAGTRKNARYVDLNRNFPHRWRYAGRYTPTYSGPRKASEPETRALMRFVKRIEPRTTVVFHQPLRGVDTYRAKSRRLVRALARAMRLPLRRFDCSGVCRGTFTGWHNKRTPGRAVTVEFGPDPKDRKLDRAARAVLRVGARY